MSEENKKFILAIIITAILSLLTYQGVISEEVFASIISIIIGYYFGTVKEQEKLLYVHLDRETKEQYKMMLVRFASFMLCGGIALVLEKYITTGAVVTYPPLPDHGLYGIILIVLGSIILTRTHKEWWWEKKS